MNIFYRKSLDFSTYDMSSTHVARYVAANKIPWVDNEYVASDLLSNFAKKKKILQGDFHIR
jgi:hypothetical protein